MNYPCNLIIAATGRVAPYADGEIIDTITANDDSDVYGASRNARGVGAVLRIAETGERVSIGNDGEVVVWTDRPSIR